MNLLKSLAAVSSMTMFSRVLGFARDAIVARIFGAGMATDAFFVAFKLPNLLRRIFAEGAFSQAFVPILAEYKSKQGEDATRVFVSYVSGLLTLALAVVTVAGMLADRNSPRQRQHRWVKVRCGKQRETNHADVKQCWSKRRNREAVPRIQNRSHQRRQGDQQDIGKGNL